MFSEEALEAIYNDTPQDSELQKEEQGTCTYVFPQWLSE